MKRKRREAGHQAGVSRSGWAGVGREVWAASVSALATLLAAAAAALPRSFITDNEGTAKLSGFSHSRGPPLRFFLFLHSFLLPLVALSLSLLLSHSPATM